MKPLIPMGEKQYNRLLTFLRKTPRREKLSAAVVRILPPVFFAVYGIELLLLAASTVQNHFSLSPCLNLVGAVLSPALCLFSSSALRTLINRERPYELLPITPLIHKDTRGRSFPSNHTASAFVLAITALSLSPALFAVMLILAFLTGLSRLAAGLHWPEDVLAGALLGCFFGVLAMFLF